MRRKRETLTTPSDFFRWLPIQNLASSLYCICHSTSIRFDSQGKPIRSKRYISNFDRSRPTPAAFWRYLKRWDWTQSSRIGSSLGSSNQKVTVLLPKFHWSIILFKPNSLLSFWQGGKTNVLQHSNIDFLVVRKRCISIPTPPSMSLLSQPTVQVRIVLVTWKVTILRAKLLHLTIHCTPSRTRFSIIKEGEINLF